MQPLVPVLLEAAAGRCPPDDGAVVVLPPLAPGLEAVVSFTARVYVCTALPEDEALHLVPDAYGGATDPGTLLALGRGGAVGVLDTALVRDGTGGEPVLPLRHDLDDHPRVRHARAVRCDVVVRGDERGLVTLATGAAGRRELSVQALRPGTGDGRSLIRDALIGETGPIFAAVSPGNARSLRTFLALGFAPVGSEVFLHVPKTIRLRYGACAAGRSCFGCLTTHRLCSRKHQ